MSEPFIGEIKMFAGNYAPRNYALCTGALLDVATHQALFSLIGTTYGGDGRSNFRLPDMRGRVPIHQGQGPGLTNRSMGQSFGVENVTLTTSQIPNHTHTMQASSNDAVTNDPVGRVLAKTSVNAYDNTPENAVENAPQAISEAGSGYSHGNVMPFLGVNFIIALLGTYPERP